MPSFDIVSEVDKQELDNALNQARKELATRFDFKNTTADILAEKDKITLTADAARLRGLREIRQTLEARCRLAEHRTRRGDLIRWSRPAGNKVRQGLEGDKAKESSRRLSQGSRSKPVARSTNSRLGKKERRLASRHSVRTATTLVATNFKISATTFAL
jgi:uncharacterized protein YajQ (UPF0234 family)